MDGEDTHNPKSAAEPALRKFVRQMGDPTSIWDRVGILHAMNRAAAHLMAGTPGEFIGRSISELFPDRASDYLERIRNVLDEGAGTLYEDDVQLPTGRRSFLSLYQVLPEGLLGSRMVQVISVDTRCRRQRLSEKTSKIKDFHDVQRMAHIGMWRWDIMQNKVNCSDQMYHIFGIEPQELNFETVRATIHPEDRDYWETRIKETLDDDMPYCIDHRICRPDGRKVWIHNDAEVVRDNHGTPVEMFGTAQDITDRKRLEEKLAESKTRFTLAELLAGIGHWERNLNKDTAYWSPGLYRIFGLDHTQPAPDMETFMTIIHRDDRKKVLNFIKKAAAANQPIDVIYRIRRPSGEMRTLHSVLCPRSYGISNEQDDLFGLLRDITEERAMQVKLESITATERSAIRRDVHDTICQDLSAIAFLADNLKESPDTSHRQRADAIQIEKLAVRAIEQAQTIADGLKPLPQVPDALDRALQAMTEQISSIYKIDCRFESRKTTHIADGRVATQLLLITREAVINAAKHSRADQIEIFLSKWRGRISLRVIDNGVGLTGKAPRNRGQGLKLMRERSDVIGAELEITARRNGGTIVTIRWQPSTTSPKVHGVDTIPK